MVTKRKELKTRSQLSLIDKTTYQLRIEFGYVILLSNYNKALRCIDPPQDNSMIDEANKNQSSSLSLQCCNQSKSTHMHHIMPKI